MVAAAPTLTEKQLQAAVVNLARLLGYRVARKLGMQAIEPKIDYNWWQLKVVLRVLVTPPAYTPNLFRRLRRCLAFIPQFPSPNDSRRKLQSSPLAVGDGLASSTRAGMGVSRRVAVVARFSTPIALPMNKFMARCRRAVNWITSVEIGGAVIPTTLKRFRIA
jgi:hypothetical protein